MKWSAVEGNPVELKPLDMLNQIEHHRSSYDDEEADVRNVIHMRKSFSKLRKMSVGKSR